MNKSGHVTRYRDQDAERINSLHEEFLGAARRTLQIGIQIGKLLEDKKGELGHGNWLPWCEKNLAFTERTARNYMRLWTHRAQLKSANVSDLAGAYRLLEVKRGGVSPSHALVRRGRGPVDPVQLFLDATRPDVAKMTLLERLRAAAGILAGR